MRTTLLDQHEMDAALRHVLSNKAMQCNKDSNYEIYPGLTQREALSSLKQIVDEIAGYSGEATYAAYTDMSKAKTPMGTWMDSATVIAGKGLNYEQDKDYLECIKLVSNWWAEAGRDKVNKKGIEYIVLPKNSNLSWPTFSTSNKQRINDFRQGLRDYSNMKEMPRIGHSGIRLQPEAPVLEGAGALVEKQRPITYPKDIYDEIRKYLKDPLEIEEQGVNIFSKTPRYSEVPFLGRARPRFVGAVSYLDNSFLILMRQLIMNPHWVSEKMYVHRSHDQIYSKIRHKIIECYDFSNFDRTVTMSEIRAIFDVIRYHFPLIGDQINMIVDLIENFKLYQFDLLLPPISNKIEILYYLTQADSNAIHGIISGLGLTDVIGKIIGTGFWVWSLKTVGVKIETKEDAEQYILNMADDNIIVHDNKEIIDKLNEHINTQKVKSVTVERPRRFLGNQIQCDDIGRAEGVCASPTSFVVNSLAPEYSSGTMFRKYAIFGLNDRWNISEGRWSDDKTAKLIEEFYIQLKNIIPHFDEKLEEETELATKGVEIQRILQKYNLRKFEEIYYLISIQDLDKEDAEAIGVLVPLKDVLEDIPQISSYVT